MFLINFYVRVKLFLEDKEAASAIEYAIVATMVAVALVAFITPVGEQLKVTFNNILTAIGGKAI